MPDIDVLTTITRECSRVLTSGRVEPADYEALYRALAQAMCTYRHRMLIQVTTDGTNAGRGVDDAISAAEAVVNEVELEILAAFRVAHGR